MDRTCQFLIFFISVLWPTCFAATEFFVYLTQDANVVNGTYYIHYVNVTAGLKSWTTLAVPNFVPSIEDVEFNYMTKVFYFSSSQEGNKGIWKGSFDLQNVYKSHQLREETTPQTIRAYPGYDVAFVYDKGYLSILAISLRNEKEDLRIKSLFEEAEGLNGNFFLDTEKNRLIAENESFTLFSSKLNGNMFRSEFTLPAQYAKGAKLLGYDSSESMLHYCVSGALFGMKLEGQDHIAAQSIPCSKIVASGGTIYYTNTSSQCVKKFKYNATSVTVLDESYLHFPFNSSQKIISFKRYEFNETSTGMCNSLKNCNHICVPADETGRATCACTDYYVSTPFPNGTTTCTKETLHTPGIIYAVSLVANNTLFYRLEGDPSRWIRRPQREQLFTIRSGIVGLSVDWDQERLLIAETQYRQIASAKMDGSFGTLAHFAGLSMGVKSIAYDWVGGNAVWFDPVFQWLRIVPLTDYHNMMFHRSPESALSSILSLSSTSIYKTALAASELEGYALTLDANEGFLFFLDRDDAEGSIHLWRTLMDGSDADKIYSYPASVFDIDSLDEEGDSLPGAVTVDFTNKYVWTAFCDSVFVNDYQGKLIARFEITPGNYNVDNCRLAAAQMFNSSYLFLALTNTSNEKSEMFVYETVLHANKSCCSQLILRHQRSFHGEFRAMTSYQETPKISAKLNCTVLQCQFMCTNIGGAAACICPDGYTWNATKNECDVNNSAPASPVVVYNTQERICYRSLDTIHQPSSSIGPSLFDSDYCFPNEPEYFSGKKVFSIMEPDHYTYRLYAVQQNHMPAAIFNLRLRQASRVFEWISIPTLGIVAETPSDEWEVFYAGNTVMALAFDWLGRNLYIADQSSQSIVVLRDNYYYPTLIREKVNISSLVVDALRRKIYWATFSNDSNTSAIYQSNLDATGDCLLARNIQGLVIQMHIAYSNNTLIYLEQPANRFGWFDLIKLPPFSSCNQPTAQYVKIALANVTQFSVYQGLMLLSSSSTNDLKLYTSSSMGQQVDEPILLRKGLPSSGMRGPIKSLAVVNPYLLDENGNETSPSNWSFKDKCAALDHGRCEHLCLASWNGNETTSRCACTDGMVLLPDQRHCAPRPIDLLNEGAIISVDDYHHKIFMLPLKTVSDPSVSSFSVQSNLSALFIHAKARPYSVAFDAITSEIYFGDHERGSIIRVNPQAQMTRDPKQGHMEETVVHLGNKVYGLFIDQDSRLLYYTHREGHYVAVLDMETKAYTPIYTADAYTSFYGVVMDRRVDRMHLYVATRNVSTVPPGTTSSSNFKPSTWSAIVRCLPNGANCTTVYNVTAEGTEKTKTVPWIYELSIDYQRDRLYFSTGQNRSIMYLDLKDATNTPKVFAVEGGDKDPSFIYGVQVYGDYLLASDWQHRGIHVFDLRTGKKKGVIGGSFFTGLNGIAVFSKDHEEMGQFNQACVHGAHDRFCSHICIPMPNNKRACKCPQGGDPVDGVNCKDVLACPRPEADYGSFNEHCTLRPNASCNFTCSTGPQIMPGFGGKSYQLECRSNSNMAFWSQAIDGLCRLVPTSPRPSTTPTAPGTGKTTTKRTTTKKPTTSASKVTESPRAGSSTPPPVIDRKAGEPDSGSAAPATTPASAGIIIGIVVVVILLVGTIVGLFVYFRRRPNARGFRRLDDPPGQGNLITGAAAVTAGVPSGTVAFRNPMFGMEDIDNVTVVQQSNQSSAAIAAQSSAREGQVVIF